MKAAVLLGTLAVVVNSTACTPRGVQMAENPAVRQQNIGARAAAMYKPDRHTDEFTKASYVDLELIGGDAVRADLACTHTHYKNSVRLTVRKFTSAAGASDMLLNVTFYSSEWLFLRDIGGLIVLADSTPTEYSANNRTNRDVITGTELRESQWYEFPAANAAKIVNASLVKMRLWGAKGTCDFVLPQESIELLRLFLRREMGQGAQPDHPAS